MPRAERTYQDAYSAFGVVYGYFRLRWMEEAEGVSEYPYKLTEAKIDAADAFSRAVAARKAGGQHARGHIEMAISDIGDALELLRSIDWG